MLRKSFSKLIYALRFRLKNWERLDIEIADFVLKDVMLFELSFQFDMKIKMASTLCTHYHRKCQIKVSSFNSLLLEIVNMYLLLFQTSCCNEVFGCLQCHNEIQSHKAKLKDIKALICLNCKYQHDGITNICVQCDTQFGEVRILFVLFLIHRWKNIPFIL